MSAREVWPVGRFFHSRDARGDLDWQGRVISEARPGLYRVVLFSWVSGDENGERLVAADDMRNWSFYEDNEAMIAAGDRWLGGGNAVRAATCGHRCPLGSARRPMNTHRGDPRKAAARLAFSNRQLRRRLAALEREADEARRTTGHTPKGCEDERRHPTD